MKEFILICVTVLSLLLTTEAKADEVIRAVVDKHRVPLNETVILTVTLTGSNLDEPNLPHLEGLVAYPAGQSQNISIINGQMASSSSYTYILQPKSIGTVTIGPIQVKQGNDIHQTDPIQIEITKAGAIQTKAQNNSSSIPIQTESSNNLNEETQKSAFAKTSTDKKEAYVGEQVTFSYKFYRKVNLLNQPKYQPPTFTNFWVEDLPPEKLYYEMINGQKYIVSELNMALFPTTAGKQTIGSTELDCRIPAPGSRRDPFSLFDEDPFEFFSNDPFDAFSGKDLKITTPPIDFTVKELPLENKPPDFNNAVGQFKIEARLDKTSALTYQAVTLSVEISGTGNIQSIKEPALVIGTDFKIYDSGSSNDLKKTDGIISGKKIFKKLLIPTKAGEETIPSIRFSYFDTKKKEYEIITTPPLRLKVEQGKEENQNITPEPEDKNKPVKIIEDIRFIKTYSPAFEKAGNFLSERILWLSLCFPGAFTIACLFVRIRSIRRERNPEIFISNSALNFSSKKLKRLKSRLKSMSPQQFYAELQEIMTTFLSKKLGSKIQGLQSKELAGIFGKRAVSDEIIKAIEFFNHQSDYARFAPSQINTEDILDEIDKMQKLLIKIDQIL